MCLEDFSQSFYSSENVGVIENLPVVLELTHRFEKKLIFQQQLQKFKLDC